MFAFGIFLLVFGVQTLFVDRWIMSFGTPVGTQNVANNTYFNGNSGSAYRNAGYSNPQNTQARVAKRVYQTREWMPWSLLAAGSIIVLYTYSLAPAASSSES